MVAVVVVVVIRKRPGVRKLWLKLGYHIFNSISRFKSSLHSTSFRSHPSTEIRIFLQQTTDIPCFPLFDLSMIFRNASYLAEPKASNLHLVFWTTSYLYLSVEQSKVSKLIFVFTKAPSEKLLKLHMKVCLLTFSYLFTMNCSSET